jgi:NTE family protein
MPLHEALLTQPLVFDLRQNSLQAGVGLALSGGGFRAMLFHAGALLRMNEFGLLSKIDRISSVSGGSIAAGILAANWPKFGSPDAAGILPNFAQNYVATVLAFAKEKLDLSDIAIGLLPMTSAADQAANSYDHLLFHGLTLNQTPHRPEFVFCATNLSTGDLFRFTKAYAGDYLLGYIKDPSIKLATAVAASAAFPPFLSPMILDAKPEDFTDWPANPGDKPFDAAPFRDGIALCDGGVYDNHGLEPIVKRYVTNFVSDGGAPFLRSPDVHTDWLSQLRRILDLEDNQVRALRRRDLIGRFKLGAATVVNGEIPESQQVAGARLGAYWGVDTDPTPMTMAGGLDIDLDKINQLASTPTRLSDPGESRARELINWGYAIVDRSIRAHYRGSIILAATPPHWPFPEQAGLDRPG